MIRIFREFDKTGKGYITEEDIDKKANEYGETLKKDILDSIMENCSGDKKKITFEEFYNIMNFKYY